MLKSIRAVADNDAEKEQPQICRNRAVRADTDSRRSSFRLPGTARRELTRSTPQFRGRQFARLAGPDK